MPLIFKKHYTRDEARALLPSVRQWLAHLATLRRDLAGLEKALSTLCAEGRDAGGDLVNQQTRGLADCLELLAEFNTRQIQIKDLDRGLIDFPAIIDGREVFLCWELGEEDIDYWHDLQAGYAGREKL